MFSFILCECETCVTLMAEQSLRVYESKVLSKIFGPPKREGVL